MHKILLAAFALLLLAEPATAQSSSRPLDIGMAQIGMRLNQLRFAAWPPNTKLVCSQDQDKPPGAEHAPLGLPGAMMTAKVVRCALFTEAAKDQWIVRQVPLAGTLTEFWFMAIADDDGSERIFQITARQPQEAFPKTSAAMIERWGTPVLKAPHFIRWVNGTAEGQMVDDNEGTVIFLFDTKLHQLLDSRMPKGKPKKRE